MNKNDLIDLAFATGVALVVVVGLRMVLKRAARKPRSSADLTDAGYTGLYIPEKSFQKGEWVYRYPQRLAPLPPELAGSGAVAYHDFCGSCS